MYDDWPPGRPVNHRSLSPLCYGRAVRARRSLVALLALAACSPPTPRPTEDVVIDGRRAMDATAVDVAPPIDPCGPAVCGPAERCGPTVDGGGGSGNGVDDDCDGLVDEGCLCAQGSMRACFAGASDRRNIGRCRDGMMTCGELGLWSDCTGGTGPVEEQCNGVDDDCDGMVDEALEGCASALRCPAFLSLQPLQELVVDGATIDPSATGFRWALECPSSVTSCPAISDPTARSLRVLLTQAGRYTLRSTVTRGDGSSGECVTPVYVDGSGMRVELSWDTQGGIASAGADLDLHVAVIDRERATPSAWFTADDCYYATCKAPGGVVNWSRNAADTRFAPTADVARCANAPPPWGDRFVASGRCWNPRLDTDTTECDPAVRDPRDARFCFVENVSVDAPARGRDLSRRGQLLPRSRDVRRWRRGQRRLSAALVRALRSWRARGARRDRRGRARLDALPGQRGDRQRQLDLARGGRAVRHQRVRGEGLRGGAVERATAERSVLRSGERDRGFLQRPRLQALRAQGRRAPRGRRPRESF
jgi:hypothetical protein